MSDSIIIEGERLEETELGEAKNPAKSYPGWKNAQDHILRLFEIGELTYGTILTKDRLSEWFYIPILDSGLHTFEEYVARESLFYNSVAALKESLIENHCLCLSNDRGIGWEILHPDDQIKIEVQKRKQSAFRDIEKASTLLANIRHELLSPETQRIRYREMAYCAAMTRGMPNKKRYKEIRDNTED